MLSSLLNFEVVLFPICVYENSILPVFMGKIVMLKSTETKSQFISLQVPFMLSGTLETFHKRGKGKFNSPSTTCWRYYFFSLHLIFLISVSISHGWSYMYLCLALQFCFTDLHICFFVGTVIFLFCFYHGSVIFHKIWKVNPSRTALLVQDFFNYLGFFIAPYEF